MTPSGCSATCSAAASQLHATIGDFLIRTSSPPEARAAIEKIIRDLHHPVTPGGHVEVTVVTKPHPHRPEYGDPRFLASAEYTVKVVAPDGRTIEFKAEFDVDPPPGGRLHDLQVHPVGPVTDADQVALIRAVAEEART